MRVQALIVGAGPAGLSAARALRADAVESVLVVDREAVAGGVPRHSAHTGFGARDLRRVLSGPAYARELERRARDAGASLLLGTQVTGWGAGGELELTGPSGRQAVRAGAIILATGCRERPRAARLVPGTRPAGVLTTGTLQQLVYLERRPVGPRAVVVGAEHVSFSALMTLAHGGARALVMVTELPHHQSVPGAHRAAALRFGVRLHTRTALTRIEGDSAVRAVELTDLATGAGRRLECELVVFTADWIPDHELAVLAGAELDPATHGPRVDEGLRTSRPGLFAAGNVVHPAESAGVAAQAGASVAGPVVGYLGGEPWPDPPLPLHCEPPLRWVTPGALSLPVPDPRRLRFHLRAGRELRDVRLEIAQGERRLAVVRLRRVLPGRSVTLGAGWTAHVDPAGGSLRLRVRSARPRT